MNSEQNNVLVAFYEGQKCPRPATSRLAWVVALARIRISIMDSHFCMASEKLRRNESVVRSSCVRAQTGLQSLVEKDRAWANSVGLMERAWKKRRQALKRNRAAQVKMEAPTE